MKPQKPSRKSSKDKLASVPLAIPLTPAELKELREDRRAAEAYFTARWGKVRTTSEMLKEMGKVAK